MSAARPCEETRVHTRLLKCALEVDDSRAYWSHTTPGQPATASTAFEQWWFGARTLARVRVLLTNFHARYDAFPAALPVLQRWSDMDPTTRSLICHWHLQLSDPLYRAFTGDFLPARREHHRPELHFDRAVAWVGEQGPGRWTMTTRQQFASKLLSAALSAGLVTGRRDPRPLTLPRVDDRALSYLLHLLRGVDFAGTLLDNPYLRSVGLQEDSLSDRHLPGVHLRRQAGLLDLMWTHADLDAWAADQIPPGAS